MQTVELVPGQSDAYASYQLSASQAAYAYERYLHRNTLQSHPYVQPLQSRER